MSVSQPGGSDEDFNKERDTSGTGPSGTQSDRRSPTQAAAITRRARKTPDPVKVRVPGKAWDVLSSDGATYYQVWRDNDGELHDNCKAGEFGKSCHHKETIRAMGEREDAGLKAEPKFIPVADPVDEDPFAGHPGEKQPPVEKPTPARGVVGRWEAPAFYDPFYESEAARRSLAGWIS